MKALSKCHPFIRTNHIIRCKFQSAEKALSFHNVSLHKCLKSSNQSIPFQCRPFSTTYPVSSFFEDPGSKPFVPQKVTTTPQHDGKSLLDRYIFVKTLDNFYEDVPAGIILDTAYADSRPGSDYDPIVPVVVGLHDTPGSHHDLVPLLTTLAKMGCRTVTPTYPGHGNTQGLITGFDDIFSQSTMEKAVFIHDFLADLGIERVDLLVAVGASAYPAMRLCGGSDTSSFYRSMALISPWPLLRPRYEANAELTKKIQHLWDRPLFRAPARLLLPVYKVGDIHNSNDKITTAYLLNNLDLGEAGGLALAVGVMNLPRMVIFGELDHAVEKELYYDVVSKLEIPLSNVSVFHGKMKSPKLPGAVVFPEGGYDLHLRHAGLLSAYLLNLIKLFHPHIRI